MYTLHIGSSPGPQFTPILYLESAERHTEPYFYPFMLFEDDQPIASDFEKKTHFFLSLQCLRTHACKEWDHLLNLLRISGEMHRQLDPKCASYSWRINQSQSRHRGVHIIFAPSQYLFFYPRTSKSLKITLQSCSQNTLIPPPPI